jgi:endonuclease/exonuclease/phosphatase family metal-dependent hydrolase
MTAPSADPRFPAFADAWQFLNPGRPQPPTLGVHDRDQWPDPFACDFIFATNDLCPRLRNVAVDATTAASDHQPVLVELG